MARYDKLISDTLWPAFVAERERLDALDRWYRWDHDDPISARQATREHNELAKRSQTPLGNLVVTAVAQELYVEGYRRADAPEDKEPWRIWQVNGMDARQIRLHRAALAYGEAHALVLPGMTSLGESIPRIRPLSPRRAIAFWDDPADDDWPMFLMRCDPARVRSDRGWSILLYDDSAEYRYQAGVDGSKLTFIEERRHDVGVCPSVRYANQLDLEGRTPGEVEPFVPLFGRIDQTTFDRLLVQRYASWKVRTIAGMTKPDTDEEANRTAMNLKIEDLLISDNPETRFGTLDETSPDGFINSTKFDLQVLSAVSQTPSYELLGDLINLSAEALVAARASLARKADERRHSFGKSHEQTLRLASRIMGDLDAAADWSAQVMWKDTEGRSLGQAADALGKLAQMLGVPVEMLWEKIPGWTQTDVDRAKDMVAAGDPVGQLVAELSRGMDPNPATI